MTTFMGSWRALETAQHSAKGASLVLRFVIRPMGRVFAAAAHQVGLTPNAVTFLSSVVTLVGVATLMLWSPSVWCGLVVSFCLVVGFGLDSADGQVARLSRTSSLAGEWLDHVTDSAKMILVHTGVLVAWYRFTDLGTAWLLVPLAFQVISILLYTGLTLVALLKRPHKSSAPAPSGSPSMLRAVALLPVDFGVLGLSFLLWGSVPVYAGAYAVLLVLNTLILAAFLVKWFGELRSIDRPAQISRLSTTAPDSGM